MGRLGRTIRSVPILGRVAATVVTELRRPFFRGAEAYWEERYQKGRGSGDGSYGRLAEFKAEVVNRFVEAHGIASVVEFGCGDGNQLGLASYPRYTGLDVSPTAIRLCKERFAADKTKSFYLYDTHCFVDHQQRFVGDLTLSLDVLYHIMDEVTFNAYLEQLFDAARRHVIVYSSNTDERVPSLYLRHWRFTPWVAERRPEWRLVETIDNRYPQQGPDDPTTSHADFYIFTKSVKG